MFYLRTDEVTTDKYPAHIIVNIAAKIGTMQIISMWDYDDANLTLVGDSSYIGHPYAE